MISDPLADIARLVTDNQADSAFHAPNKRAQESEDIAVTIHVSPLGNLANRMIQAMSAMALAARLHDMTGIVPKLSNIFLPSFGLNLPLLPPDSDQNSAVLIVDAPIIDAVLCASAILNDNLRRIDIRSYAQQMVNFPSLDQARKLFPDPCPDSTSTGDDEILCNIRQGDILDARHPDYVLIPVAFYQGLIRATGKKPVFIGQLDDTPYLAMLRAAFPDAAFWPSQGADADFSRLLKARHIVPSISSFGWLGAWLSRAETVHLPVLGLLNPRQSVPTDLLPRDDTRYRFYQFPFHYAVTQNLLAKSHAAISGMWRQANLDALTGPRPPADPDALLTAFDEAEYLSLHPDVARAVHENSCLSGHHHFVHHGGQEGLTPFMLDCAFYCTEYPIAAQELTEGLYRDPWHHYVKAGRARGYLRG
jgi:hypothetical protein